MASLAKQSAISLSEYERRLLWLVRGKVEWAARYPVNMTVEGMVRYDERGGLPDVFTIQYPGDHDGIRHLFARIESDLARLIAGLPE